MYTRRILRTGAVLGLCLGSQLLGASLRAAPTTTPGQTGVPTLSGQAAPAQTAPSRPAPAVPPKQMMGTPERALPTRPQIAVRFIGPNGGSAIDILYNAVSGADHYTLRRGATASGPFTTLAGPPQASFTLDNPLYNPKCCEVEDLQAYLVGVGQTVYYVIDAWAGTSLLMSSAPLRMDLPSWFRGPLNVAVAKTGPNQWTIGWEPVEGASSYLVWIQVGDTPVNIYYNKQVPTSQTQLTLGGLQPGTRYRVYVAGSLSWNGVALSRDGQIYYTAP